MCLIALFFAGCFLPLCGSLHDLHWPADWQPLGVFIRGLSTSLAINYLVSCDSRRLVLSGEPREANAVRAGAANALHLRPCAPQHSSTSLLEEPSQSFAHCRELAVFKVQRTIGLPKLEIRDRRRWHPLQQQAWPPMQKMKKCSASTMNSSMKRKCWRSEGAMPKTRQAHTNIASTTKDGRTRESGFCLMTTCCGSLSRVCQ